MRLTCFLACVYVLDLSIEGSSQEELDVSETPYSDIEFSSDLEFDDLGKVRNFWHHLTVCSLPLMITHSCIHLSLSIGKSSHPASAADLDLAGLLYPEATGVLLLTSL